MSFSELIQRRKSEMKKDNVYGVLYKKKRNRLKKWLKQWVTSYKNICQHQAIVSMIHRKGAAGLKTQFLPPV